MKHLFLSSSPRLRTYPHVNSLPQHFTGVKKVTSPKIWRVAAAAQISSSSFLSPLLSFVHCVTSCFFFFNTSPGLSEGPSSHCTYTAEDQYRQQGLIVNRWSWWNQGEKQCMVDLKNKAQTQDSQIKLKLQSKANPANQMTGHCSWDKTPFPIILWLPFHFFRA